LYCYLLQGGRAQEDQEKISRRDSCSMEQIDDRRKKERIVVETNLLKTLLRKQECNSRNVFKDALNYLWIP
jgi:hypothetical protein